MKPESPKVTNADSSTGSLFTSAGVRGCIVGAIAAAIAASIRAALSPWLGMTAPLLIFPGVVALASWTGGIWAGLFTTVFSGALGLVLFVHPLEAIVGRNVDQVILLGLFAAEGALIAVLTGTLRAHQRALADALAAEQTLRYRAESANRLKQEFLGIVSHELRTPLTVPLGSLCNLTPTPAPAARGVGDLIERHAHALVRTVDNLLYVSETMAGHRPLNLQLVHIGGLCALAINSLRDDARRHGVELRLR